MATTQELKILINDTVIPDINTVIDDIYENISKNKEATLLEKEELDELQDLKKEIQTILDDIENNKLTSEECTTIYNDILQLINDTSD
jgi:predicted transcriptional regulator